MPSFLRMKIDPWSEQIAYYRARAAEYDEWFLRTGRYDRGLENNQTWFTETDRLKSAVTEADLHGNVFEIAGGTGIWTEQLSRSADRLTVLDASPEMLALNYARVGRSDVQYIQTDIFEWTVQDRYDVIFFSFWLSHVPDERFTPFWKIVQQALKPNGRVFLIDSLYNSVSTARDHSLLDRTDERVARQLNDGRKFQVYKKFYDEQTIASKLQPLGWTGKFQSTGECFFHGICFSPERDRATDP